MCVRESARDREREAAAQSCALLQLRRSTAARATSAALAAAAAAARWRTADDVGDVATAAAAIPTPYVPSLLESAETSYREREPAGVARAACIRRGDPGSASETERRDILLFFFFFGGGHGVTVMKLFFFVS